MSGKVQEDHKPITLYVEINGIDKPFVTPRRVPGSLWRQAALIAEEIESNESAIADLDSQLQFVCDVFGNQFDIGQLEDGVDARDLMKVVYAVTIFVMGQVSVASEMLMHNVDIAEIDEKKT